jgi:hypothetical protein
MAIWSPVTILTFTPICTALAMVALACSRGGSDIGNTPANCHLSFLIGPGHAQRAEAASGKIIDGLLDGGFTSPALVDICRMTCGAPLATWNCFPSAPLTVASVRLCTGSNGWK